MPERALPGTPAHQELLRKIIDAYVTDDRVFAIGVLGSIARGTWDEWSDLDLDITTTSNSETGAVVAAQALCRALGYLDALIVGSSNEDVDIVLPTLEQFSIRYHPLGTTNAHIADDLQILAGRLDRDAVLSAGVVHRSAKRTPDTVVSEALRFAISVDTALRRRNLWQALRSLDELRWRLQELFALTHAHQRPAHALDALASPTLQAAFARTLAQAEIQSTAEALEAALDLLESATLTDGHYVVARPQHLVLSALRRRMSNRP